MITLASAADENGDGAECEDFQRGAAEENPTYRPAPVRPDDDQIASLILRCLDDPLGWMLVLDVPRLATDTGLFGRFPDTIQQGGGGSGRSLLISLYQGWGGNDRVGALRPRFCHSDNRRLSRQGLRQQ